MKTHATRVLHFAVTGALLAGGALGCASKHPPHTNTGRMTPPDDGGGATPTGGEEPTTPPVEEPPSDTPVSEPPTDSPISTTGTMNMRKVEEPTPQT